ncbi:MAG: hypothetical protein P8107_08395 [Spirochaetia bacterium]
MKKIVLCIVVFSALCLVFADVSKVKEKADQMDENGSFAAEKDLLLEQVAKTIVCRGERPAA